MAGMDLVCGNIRQVGRQLACEIRPLALLASVWFTEMMFTAV